MQDDNFTNFLGALMFVMSCIICGFFVLVAIIALVKYLCAS